MWPLLLPVQCSAAAGRALYYIPHFHSNARLLARPGPRRAGAGVSGAFSFFRRASSIEAELGPNRFLPSRRNSPSLPPSSPTYPRRVRVRVRVRPPVIICHHRRPTPQSQSVAVALGDGEREREETRE